MAEKTNSMTKRFALIRVTLLIGLFFTTQISSANEQPESLRLLHDMSRFNEYDYLNQDQSTGVSNGSYMLLLNEIDYPFEMEYQPTLRGLNILDDDSQAACFAFKGKDASREEKYIFSLPIAFFVNMHIFPASRVMPLPSTVLSANNKIKSLEALMNSLPDSKILKTTNISISDELEAQYARVSELQVVYQSSEDKHTSRAELIESERVDFIITYPSELYNFENRKGILSSKGFGIESIPEVASSYIMCNHNNKSQAFIKEINRRLLAMYELPEYLQNHLNFTPPQYHPLIYKTIEQAQKDTLPR